LSKSLIFFTLPLIDNIFFKLLRFKYCSHLGLGDDPSNSRTSSLPPPASFLGPRVVAQLGHPTPLALFISCFDERQAVPGIFLHPEEGVDSKSTTCWLDKKMRAE
jgi:hypothetical protein